MGALIRKCTAEKWLNFSIFMLDLMNGKLWGDVIGHRYELKVVIWKNLGLVVQIALGIPCLWT